MTEERGSVRIDLLGGTLDIPPMNLIIPDVVTLNLATNLEALVRVEDSEDGQITIESVDYGSTNQIPLNLLATVVKEQSAGPLNFLLTILSNFKFDSGLKISTQSGSPAGAGLGGSSAMGITFAKALNRHLKGGLTSAEILRLVQNVEAKILNCGPTGYQDYYPAIYGGILALRPTFTGVNVEQIYKRELAESLERKLLLVFSGESRLSGINNWEVYKGYFDKSPTVVEGLHEIAKLANRAYASLSKGEYDLFYQLIAQEGELRDKLFPGILTTGMRDTIKKLFETGLIVGQKVCGAGGGGCFLLVLKDSVDSNKVTSLLDVQKYKHLPFKVKSPLPITA